MSKNNFLIEIKNFFEDFFLHIYNKFFSSKYVLKGKCTKCGECCRNILFSTKKGFIKSEKLFYRLQKKHRYYRNFKISGVVNDKNDIQNGALTFTCRFVSKNNKCMIYLIRPMYCRDYPNIVPEFIYNGVTMLDKCGYYFDVNKKFDSYLK